MFCNLHQHFKDVKARQQHLVLLSPGRSCWYCEKTLPLFPTAVIALPNSHDDSLERIFLTCSEVCEDAIIKELIIDAKSLRTANASETHVLLSRIEDLIAVVEGWMCGDRPFYLIHSYGTMSREHYS